MMKKENQLSVRNHGSCCSLTSLCKRRKHAMRRAARRQELYLLEPHTDQLPERHDLQQHDKEHHHPVTRVQDGQKDKDHDLRERTRECRCSEPTKKTRSRPRPVRTRPTLMRIKSVRWRGDSAEAQLANALSSSATGSCLRPRGVRERLDEVRLRVAERDRLLDDMMTPLSSLLLRRTGGGQISVSSSLFRPMGWSTRQLFE